MERCQYEEVAVLIDVRRLLGHMALTLWPRSDLVMPELLAEVARRAEE